MDGWNWASSLKDQELYLVEYRPCPSHFPQIQIKVYIKLTSSFQGKCNCVQMKIQNVKTDDCSTNSLVRSLTSACIYVAFKPWFLYVTCLSHHKRNDKRRRIDSKEEALEESLTKRVQRLEARKDNQERSNRMTVLVFYRSRVTLNFER